LIGVAVSGVSFGPVFPTTLAIVTTIFPRAPGTAASIASATGSLGGTLLPWVQGNLMEFYGPTAGMLLVLATTVAMLALEMARRVLIRRQAHPERSPAW
jgi:fucose permease